MTGEFKRQALTATSSIQFLASASHISLRQSIRNEPAVTDCVLFSWGYRRWGVNLTHSPSTSVELKNA